MQGLVHGFHTGKIILWTALHKGPHDIMLDIGRQQAQGAQEPGIRRNQNGRRAQELRQWPGMQRSSTSKGYQGKPLRIVPFSTETTRRAPTMLLLTICTIPAAAS